CPETWTRPPVIDRKKLVLLFTPTATSPCSAAATAAPVVAALSMAVAYTPPCTSPHGWWCSGPRSIQPATASAEAWSTWRPTAAMNAVGAVRVGSVMEGIVGTGVLHESGEPGEDDRRGRAPAAQLREGVRRDRRVGAPPRWEAPDPSRGARRVVAQCRARLTRRARGRRRSRDRGGRRGDRPPPAGRGRPPLGGAAVGG